MGQVDHWSKTMFFKTAAEYLEMTLKIQTTLTGMLVGGTAICLGIMTANAVPGDGAAGGSHSGADVAVCDMPSIYRWGTVNGETAYSVGTTSVNLGDTNLPWDGSTDNHPRIPQNLFRYMDGRLEHLGASWCKDGFCALQLTGCAPGCSGGGGCPEYLTPGCADPYSDSLNGSQGGLAPRHQCTADTGHFTYPPQGMPGAQATVGRRMRVFMDDLNPSMNDGAVYYTDSMYLHNADGGEGTAGNDNNNASYKRCTVGSLSSAGYRLTPAGSTRVGDPGIYAWEENSTTVKIESVDLPADGRVFVGSDALDNGDGTHNYEYAIYNLNSHDNVGHFSVPIPTGVTVTNAGFSDIHHHSGEPIDTSDWTITTTATEVTWQCPGYNAGNDDENAVRWNMMFNFWFTANADPQEVNAEIGAHKTNASHDVAIFAPGGPSNPFDLNMDGCIDGGDLGIFLALWGTANADFDGDGTTNGSDAGLLLAAWEGKCK